MEDFEKLSLSLSTNNTLIPQIIQAVGESTIERWVTVENDSIIQNAMMSDAHEKLNIIMEEDTPESTLSSDTLKEDGTDKKSDRPAVLPSLAQMINLFSELENVSYDCNVSDAVCTLHKTKTALSAAKKKTEPVLGRQLLISKIVI